MAQIQNKSNNILRYEEDPDIEMFSYTCTDTGFFEIPKESAWPTCLRGPLCDLPPEIPQEGTRLIIPKVMELEIPNICGAEATNILIKCPSFQQIYIKEAQYGRKA